MEIHDDCEQIILSEEQINNQVKLLGKQITQDYKHKNPLLIGVLRGSFVFISDLIRNINLDLEVDFLAVGSYGNSTESSGIVRVLKDLEEDIEDRNVLLIEDIVDTGLTLNFLLGYLQSRNPGSLKICCLLNKPDRREVEVDPQYCGFEVDDHFLVGYGLDFAQQYRNLPYIAQLKPEIINS